MIEEQLQILSDLSEQMGEPEIVANEINDWIGFENAGETYSKVLSKLHGDHFSKEENLYAGMMIGWRLHQLKTDESV